MNITFWGTRGSIAAPGDETKRYGGNTSCVEVRGQHDELLILDAGTGLRALGMKLAALHAPRRIDILLTHLHMDHLQGLGFFAPLYLPEFEIHIWGPASTTLGLETRLSRYLSPPLFPVRLADLPRRPILHDVPCAAFDVHGLTVHSSLVCHPGPTAGYKIVENNVSMAYIPDHEPALGLINFPIGRIWTSGMHVARGVDLLIHDAQYTDEEYPQYIGWGHSSVTQALQFAELAQVQRLVMFHHDPARTDENLDKILGLARFQSPVRPVIMAAEGVEIRLM